MSVDPLTAAFAQDSASGLFLPTRVRRTVIPYDDLSALNPPTGYPQLSTDLITSLSVLVGQNYLTPRLVAVNGVGQIGTATTLNYITFAASTANIGDKQILVQDPSFIGAGAAIWVFPSAAHGGPEHGPYIVSPGGDPHTIAFSSGLINAVLPGDGIISIPLVGLQGAANNTTLNVGQSQGTLGASGPTAGQLFGVQDNTGARALLTYDMGLPLSATVAAEFVGPTASAPSVAFLASAGFSYVVTSIAVCIGQIGANTGMWFVRVTDGAGVEQWVEMVGATAVVGAMQRIAETDLRVACTQGKGVTLALHTTIPANVLCTLSLGVYLR